MITQKHDTLQFSLVALTNILRIPTCLDFKCASAVMETVHKVNDERLHVLVLPIS
jgi:hypothetical protein